MANFTLLRAALNAGFKSLSVFVIAVAVTRLAFLCDRRSQNNDQTATILWLMVEANVAIVAASVSSYRVVVLDYLCRRQVQQESVAREGAWELLNQGSAVADSTAVGFSIDWSINAHLFACERLASSNMLALLKSYIRTAIPRSECLCMLEGFDPCSRSRASPDYFA
jgi:hypothetical protein